MQGKKTFLMYVDMIHIFDELTDEQAGLLIKHIFNYVNDKNPELSDQILKIAFAPIKNVLKKDLDGWLKTCERNAENGKKGGRPSKKENPNKPKKPSGLNGNPKNPSKADKDKDKDMEKDIITNNEKQEKKIIYRKFFADFNSDPKDYRDRLEKVIKDMEGSVFTLLNESDIDYSDKALKHRIWLDFLKNAVVHIPTINDENHAYKCFLLFIKNNGHKYKKQRNSLAENPE